MAEKSTACRILWGVRLRPPGHPSLNSLGAPSGALNYSNYSNHLFSEPERISTLYTKVPRTYMYIYACIYIYTYVCMHMSGYLPFRVACICHIVYLSTDIHRKKTGTPRALHGHTGSRAHGHTGTWAHKHTGSWAHGLTGMGLTGTGLTGFSRATRQHGLTGSRAHGHDTRKDRS